VDNLNMQVALAVLVAVHLVALLLHLVALQLLVKDTLEEVLLVMWVEAQEVAVREQQVLLFQAV